MKFAFFTLGCKVNLFETQALSQLAQARGHEIVDKDADAVIVNTCTVTSVSDHKNIRAFHKLRRDNPNAVIAACGCFAQTDPERVRATGEIDLICGTRDRAQVIDLCEQAVSGQAVQMHESEDSGFETLPAGIPHGRTRALLKIEDGCNNFCTYCIIPYARGRVRSLPVEQALEQTARLADAGVHEIVLTGIEIASYGKDFEPRVPLTELLEKLLTAQPNVQFRLGSLDPRAVDDAFCERLAGFANLARHFHLSMQSGCDTVLRRMNRHYTSEEFYQVCRAAETCVSGLLGYDRFDCRLSGRDRGRIYADAGLSGEMRVRVRACIPVFRTRGHKGGRHAGAARSADQNRPRRAGKAGGGDTQRCLSKAVCRPHAVRAARAPDRRPVGGARTLRLSCIYRG